MREKFVYFEELAIRKYISKKYGKGLFGKDYELGAALILKGFFEKAGFGSWIIGLKVAPKYVKLYSNVTSINDADTLHEFLKTHLKEDDDVDVVFALESQLKTSKEISPICIQLKRFGHYQYQKDTEAMIEFLNTIKLKYGPSHSALVIFFDGHKGINVEKVHKDINWLGFPFTRVMFINTTKNEAGVWKFHIGEFWPTWGYNEYNPDDLVKQKPK